MSDKGVLLILLLFGAHPGNVGRRIADIDIWLVK